jgi:hypothetical protein
MLCNEHKTGWCLVSNGNNGAAGKGEYRWWSHQVAPDTVSWKPQQVKSGDKEKKVHRSMWPLKIIIILM